MNYEIFSKDWAEACKTALNNDQEYKIAAKDWEWPIILELQDENQTKSIYLDIFQGTCREARLSNETDVAKSEYVISANRENWLQILSGDRDPLMAIMRGSLSLKKGKLFKLARYANAAKKMVQAVSSVNTPNRTETKHVVEVSNIKPVEKKKT